jgi:hypothetical protein
MDAKNGLSSDTKGDRISLESQSYVSVFDLNMHVVEPLIQNTSAYVSFSLSLQYCNLA